MLNIKKLLTKILASLNNSGSGYYKLPDGTLLCYGRNAITVNSTSAKTSGSLYYYECSANITFPVAFIVTPTVVYGKATDNIAAIGWSNPSPTGITEIDMITGTSTTSAGTKFTIGWLAIGRWK